MKLLSDDEIESGLRRIARKRIPLMEKLRQAHAAGYDQGHEWQMRARILDAQERRAER